MPNESFNVSNFTYDKHNSRQFCRKITMRSTEDILEMGSLGNENPLGGDRIVTRVIDSKHIDFAFKAYKSLKNSESSVRAQQYGRSQMLASSIEQSCTSKYLQSIEKTNIPELDAYQEEDLKQSSVLSSLVDNVGSGAEIEIAQIEIAGASRPRVRSQNSF